MKNRHLRKNLKLCWMEYFLLCSLLLLMNQDALSSTDMKCEINSLCSTSVCQQTNQMTVDPGSNITLNCSIITGELRSSLTTSGGKYLCQCTAIKFTRALRIVYDTSSTSPTNFKQDEAIDLQCVFSGWPLPRTVHWHKDNKLISNGTDDIYHSLLKKGEVLHSTLHFPPGREEQEGFYKCSATNSIPGWSSRDSYAIELRYDCPLPKRPTINSSKITARAFSNISLTCWVDYGDSCPDDLFWHLNDNPAHLPENSDKYKVEVRKTHTKCKGEFIISIFNVTEHDEGTYRCHWECEYKDTMKAAIDLKLFVQPPTEFSTATTNYQATSNQTNTVLVSSAHSARRRDWLLPVIILSAGTAAISLMIFVHFFVKKMWKSSYNMRKGCLMETEFINRIFISYSSKDFDWVTENVISVLEKHSIAYSIHSRDFEIGRPIVQNMADNVYGSRQVLIVLSENYLASNFCREELHMAVQRGVDAGDSSLILVIINSLKKKKLPAALRKKRLLDFDKHKKKQDWEEKILRVVLEGKNAIV
ncbi:hypothetical protein ACROYT_G025300 [Oculina patagonica]